MSGEEGVPMDSRLAASMSLACGGSERRGARSVRGVKTFLLPKPVGTAGHGKLK